MIEGATLRLFCQSGVRAEPGGPSPNTAAVNKLVRAGPSASCSWKPSRVSVRRLMFGPTRRLRARPQCAVGQPGDPASRKDREPRAKPNGDRDDRGGPIWQTVHGAMSPVVLTEASFPRLGCWIVDRRPPSRRSDRGVLRCRLPQARHGDGGTTCRFTPLPEGLPCRGAKPCETGTG